MQSATFKKWLAERGCRFELHERGKGQHMGSASVTVHRADRQAVLPLIGSKKQLDPDVVRRIVDDLALDWSELPGPARRV